MLWLILQSKVCRTEKYKDLGEAGKVGGMNIVCIQKEHRKSRFDPKAFIVRSGQGESMGLLDGWLYGGSWKHNVTLSYFSLDH